MWCCSKPPRLSDRNQRTCSPARSTPGSGASQGIDDTDGFTVFGANAANQAGANSHAIISGVGAG